MIVAFAIILVVHGLIHLLGFAKAFGLAELPRLTQPVAPRLGALWLVAAFLFVAAATAFFVWPRWWWVIGACAIVVSMSSRRLPPIRRILGHDDGESGSSGARRERLGARDGPR